jgi:sporulation protein YlmC with PRC-barrel domain
MRIPDESLRGRTVLSSDGVEIGVIEGVIFETASWRVEALEVKLRSEVASRIGAGRRMFRAATILVPVEQIHSVRAR